MVRGGPLEGAIFGGLRGSRTGNRERRCGGTLTTTNRMVGKSDDEDSEEAGMSPVRTQILASILAT